MIIAVDPGASGGIVTQLCGGTGMVPHIEVHPMPETDRDVLDIIDGLLKSDLRDPSEPKYAFIERVSGYVGEGQPGSSMFNFGDKYGFIRGVLMARGFRIDRPTPQCWQKTLGLGSREHFKKPKYVLGMDKEQYKAEYRAWQRKEQDSKRDWKNKLKARAQELFPQFKVTLKTADSLLILEYARKVGAW